MSTAIESACDEIESLAALMGHRNDGTPRVRPSAAARARYLLILTEENAAAAGIAWHNPNITADGEGRVNLSWQIGDRWAALGVASEELFTDAIESAHVLALAQPPDEDECVTLALWVLSAPTVPNATDMEE